MRGARRLLRPCLGTPEEPCGEATTRSRCPACTSKLNIERGSSTARGYTVKWRRLSERIRRREHPWCAFPGCLEPATDLDHVIPIRAGGRSVRANAMPLCRFHHAAKTRQDAKEYP